MIRFLTLAALLIPGLAQAHGAHAPVADSAHSMAHLTPVALAVVVIVAGAMVLWRANE